MRISKGESRISFVRSVLIRDRARLRRRRAKRDRGSSTDVPLGRVVAISLTGAFKHACSGRNTRHSETGTLTVMRLLPITRDNVVRTRNLPGASDVAGPSDVEGGTEPQPAAPVLPTSQRRRPPRANVAIGAYGAPTGQVAKRCRHPR
jgi:hypothetical protein